MRTSMSYSWVFLQRSSGFSIVGAAVICNAYYLGLTMKALCH